MAPHLQAARDKGRQKMNTACALASCAGIPIGCNEMAGSTINVWNMTTSPDV
jgi:hypothetical protein